MTFTIDIERVTRAPELDSFTRSKHKEALYRLDVPFREAQAELDGLDECVLRSALIIFKPDAIVARKILPALALLESSGFVPVASKLVNFDRLLVREMWRYQLNIATLDRLRVVDEYLSLTPSLVVILRDTRWSPTAVPAPVRFTALKGPAKPSLRSPGQLRYDLGVVNTLFSYIHSADEPADVVREIGILFEPDERRSLQDALRLGEPWSGIEAQVGELHASNPPHSLDLEQSAVRIGVDPRSVRLQPLMEGLGRGSTNERWDRLTVLSYLFQFSEEGLVELVPNVRADEWVNFATSTARGQ